MLAVLEVACIVLACVGVGLFSIPAALIVGGVAGVVLLEAAQVRAEGPE